MNMLLSNHAERQVKKKRKKYTSFRVHSMALPTTEEMLCSSINKFDVIFVLSALRKFNKSTMIKKTLSAGKHCRYTLASFRMQVFRSNRLPRVIKNDFHFSSPKNMRSPSQHQNNAIAIGNDKISKIINNIFSQVFPSLAKKRRRGPVQCTQSSNQI